METLCQPVSAVPDVGLSRADWAATAAAAVSFRSAVRGAGFGALCLNLCRRSAREDFSSRQDVRTLPWLQE
jgi:hypothetical protein